MESIIQYNIKTTVNSNILAGRSMLHGLTPDEIQEFLFMEFARIKTKSKNRKTIMKDVGKNLSGKALIAAETVLEFLQEEGWAVDINDNQTFHSPKEWKKRGEIYGLGSVLILCHDGGCLSAYCDHAIGNYDAMERLRLCLEKKEFFVEQCTSWYSAIYEIKG